MEQLNPNAINFAYTKSKFTPDDTSKGLFMFLIMQTLITLVYQVLYMVGLTAPMWAYVVTLVLDACFVLSVYSITKYKKVNFWSNIKLNKAPTIMQAVIALGIALICIFGFSSVTNLFMELLYSAGYTSASGSDIVINNFGMYMFYTFFVCIVPAFCEEILFRGLICNGLKKISTSAAVFGSAFLFMIMHGSPDQTVHQFLLGIVLALVFLATNNLWVTMLIHFFNNFIAVTYSYIAYGDSASTATDTVVQIPWVQYAIYAIISAVVAGALIYLMLRLLTKFNKKSNEVAPIDLKETPGITESNTETEAENTQETIDGLPYQTEPVEEQYENKFSGSGKAMLIIAVVWLAIDWISALILGFMP